MPIETLLDELLSIARGSIDASEVQSRFDGLVRSHVADRDLLAAEVIRSIRLLRIKAKTMESQIALKASQRELDQMNLTDWANGTRDRASELRRDADELERIAVSFAIIEQPERPESLSGIWKGATITDDDIGEAKRSWMKAVDHFDDKDFDLTVHGDETSLFGEHKPS